MAQQTYHVPNFFPSGYPVFSQQQLYMMQQQYMMQQHAMQQPVTMAPQKPTRADKFCQKIFQNPQPLKDACQQFFAMLVACGERLLAESPDKSYVNLHLRYSDVVTVDEIDFKLHVLLYGIQLSEHFEHRYLIFKDIDITDPFRAAQIYFRTKGLYLVNHSNPEMGTNLVLKLYRVLPHNVGHLWHGQNRVPYIKREITLDDPECAEVKAFYVGSEAFLKQDEMMENLMTVISSRQQSKPAVESQVEPENE